MKPQITILNFTVNARLPQLQRSCGMKPQITRCRATARASPHACFKGAAA